MVLGINATVNGVPLHIVQKWMGHAQLSTTAIYADAVGKEEQDIAARMWEKMTPIQVRAIKIKRSAMPAAKHLP